MFSIKNIFKKKPHPFLHGIHTPLDREFLYENLTVNGNIPSELDGLYVRNGPNPVKPPNERRYHWFLGDGMVHGVKLKNGVAEWYKNRWVRSHSVSKALGEEIIPGASNQVADAVNTNIIVFAGKLWALVEAGSSPVQLDMNLNSLKHDRFGGSLKKAFTAHPHLDPASGELHAICYSVGKKGRVTHVVVSSSGEVVKESPIPVEGGPSIHDCAITKNYIVVLDLPVVFSLRKFLSGSLFPYHWKPGRPARVGLLNRHSTSSGEVRWVKIDPCYVFHPCNAYEVNSKELVLDVCAHDSMFASSNYGPDSKFSQFQRWRIDLESMKVTKDIIHNKPQEFPRFDERLTGQKYRFAYTVSLGNGSVPGNSLIKHDLQEGKTYEHDFGRGCFPGEFVFVPKDPESGEEEGWLLGYVLDMRERTTLLTILDSNDFLSPSVAEIKIPHLVPPGFHGNWVPTSLVG